MLEPFLDHWRPYLFVLSTALAVVSSTHAVLRRRDPRAALWWLVISFILPVLGPVFYYFMGINRIQRKAVRLGRRQISREPIDKGPYLSRASDPQPVSARMRHLLSLAHLVDGVVGKPLLKGNRITPLVNGDEAYPAMLKAINEAKHSIGLATYIFNHDRAGQLFIEALTRAAQRGVQVRVLIDDVGSGFAWTPVFKALEGNGIPVAYFLPTFAPWRMSYINMRNHRKIMTVDGRIGFCGGMNIHEGHMLSVQPKFATQDIHFRLEGPVVCQLQEAFREDWTFTTGEKLPGDIWFPPLEERGSVMARGIGDGPDEDFEKLRWTLQGALANAQSSVKIVTPYFIPDSALIAALNTAAMSGIQVDILLPEVNDLDLVKWASTALLWQVLERGCRVWLTPPPFDHSKLMVVDKGWVLFGSSNWDPRSLRLNFEFDVEAYDEDLAGRMDAWVTEKMSRARQVTLADVDARTLPIRLRDGLARLFVPHL